MKQQDVSHVCLTHVLSVQDEILTVIRRVDENWAEGMLGDKIGIFPILYVEVNAQTLHSKAHPDIRGFMKKMSKLPDDGSQQIPKLHHMFGDRKEYSICPISLLLEFRVLFSIAIVLFQIFL